jgi:hypothetical protein
MNSGIIEYTGKKSELQLQLAKLEPRVCISTRFQPDPDCEWDVRDPDMDADDFEAYDVTIEALVIHNGYMQSGDAVMGGSWYEFGSTPWHTDLDLHGYAPQMTEEAIQKLQEAAPGAANYEAMLTFLKQYMRDRYEAQMKESKNEN